MTDLTSRNELEALSLHGSVGGVTVLLKDMLQVYQTNKKKGVYYFFLQEQICFYFSLQ